MKVQVGVAVMVDDGRSWGQAGTWIVVGIVRIIMEEVVSGSVKVKDIL